MRVLYAEAVFGPEEVDAVVEVLRERPHQLMLGPSVKEFESGIAARFGKSRGVMVNSGSSANLLSLAALDLPAGSEVITPALTFSTTVAPLIQNQLVPAFVDVEAATFNIDAAAVTEMVGPDTRAMMIPNLIGNLPDWPALRAIADEHGLAVIEDSADTVGSLVGGEPAGRFSDISTTSFYGSHVITAAGFGGMVTTNDDVIADKVSLLRAWGRRGSLTGGGEHAPDRFDSQIDGVDYDSMYVFETLGYNMVPSEISAAFGLVQLGRLDDYAAARSANFDRLRSFFASYEHWLTLPEQLPNVTTTWLAYPMVVKDEAPFTRTQLQQYLEAADIQTRPIFTGNILRQPGFRAIPHRARPDGYPNADTVMRGGILLGCHQGLTTEQLDYMCDTFTAFADSR